MRVPYDQVFQSNSNGSVSPRCSVHINGVTMSPGVSFTQGVAFGGLDVVAIRGHDLDIEQQGDVVVIKGYFQ